MKLLIAKSLFLRNAADRDERVFGSTSLSAQWFRIMRSIVLGVLTSLGLLAFVLLFSSDRFSTSKPTDFAQDYTMGRAILEGKDPYASLETLTSKFGWDLWHHPCPHPPPVAIIGTLLAVLSYERAMLVWLILSEIGLVISLRAVFGLSWLSVSVWFLISLLWYPIHDDLAMGQIMLTMLTLISLAWTSLRAGREIPAGILIGLALSLKLIFWPLIIYFCIKRKFRVSASALGTFGGANILAGIVMGFDRIPYYYLHVGGLVASMYRGSPLNYSIFSVGTRLFSGTKSTLESLLRSDPLIDAPKLAFAVSLLLALSIFCVVFYFVLRCPDEDRSFATLICLCIVLSPTAWWFYFVLLLIPIATAVRMRGIFPKVAIGFCLLGTYIPVLVPWVFGVRVSYWIGLLLLCPLFAICVMIGCLLASRWDSITVKNRQIRGISLKQEFAETG